MITNIIAIYFGASFCFAAGVAFGVYAIKNGLFECVYNRKPKTGEIITGEYTYGKTKSTEDLLSKYDNVTSHSVEKVPASLMMEVLPDMVDPMGSGTGITTA